MSLRLKSYGTHSGERGGGREEDPIRSLKKKKKGRKKEVRFELEVIIQADGLG